MNSKAKRESTNEDDINDLNRMAMAQTPELGDECVETTAMRVRLWSHGLQSVQQIQQKSPYNRCYSPKLIPSLVNKSYGVPIESQT